jgi:hypothetical protein
MTFKWPDKNLVVCDIDEAVPIAYINVYEDNDVWIKVQGCEACGMKKPQRCCGKCPFAMDDGCKFNFDPGISTKPFMCVVMPTIVKHQMTGCNLIYKSVAGSMKGKIRRVCDPSDVFIDE